jgi:hypothetical protein
VTDHRRDKQQTGPYSEIETQEEDARQISQGICKVHEYLEIASNHSVTILLGIKQRSLICFKGRIVVFYRLF